METNHENDVSGDKNVSSPRTPIQDNESDFEFNCFTTTPSSPADQDTHKNSSPADHLFFNGRLLPHSFPLQLQQQQKQSKETLLLLTDTNNPIITATATTSRNSSVSSKDSLMSSRSNSTNSNSSSARTSSSSSSSSSSSEALEKKVSLMYKGRTNKVHNSSCKAPTATKVVMGQLYGSSQRWQHIVPVPAAVLKREDSRRSCNNIRGVSEKDHKGKKERSSTSGIWRRFFMSIIVACRECHAMEPSKKDDISQRSMKV